MAVDNSDKANGFSLLWQIENFSCLTTDQSIIESPIFVVDSLETTRWKLELHPCRSGYFKLFLTREQYDYGPEIITVSFELSFLANDSKTLCSSFHQNKQFVRCNVNSRRIAVGFTSATENTHGAHQFIESCKVLATEASMYLPNDTLTVRCRMWKEYLCYALMPPCIDISFENQLATTHINAKKFHLHAMLKDFDSFKLTKFQTIVVSDVLENNPILSSSLFLESEGKIRLHVHPNTQTIERGSFCDIFLLDCEKNKIKCASGKASVDSSGMIWMFRFSLTLSLQDLINNQESYLHDGSLHFLFEVITPGQITSQKIKTLELNSKIFHQVEMQNKDAPGKNSLLSGSLNNDLKTVLEKKLFCDATLRSKSQSFPAHKIVLCARSPVFEAMFSSPMKESHDGRIDCLDLDDDTVQQLLQYLYTDCLDELDFDKAKALYFAADKYEIMSLRSKCSEFFKNNLTQINVLDVLVLADTHRDGDLKAFAYEFIFKIYDSVIVSDDWKNFMQSHITIAADVMLQKSLSQIKKASQ